MTVASGERGTHWLIELAGACGFAGADAIKVAPDAPARDVWPLLRERCRVGDAALTRALAEHFRVSEADFSAAQPATLRLIPETIARRHLVFPISEHQRRLVVASCNPADLDAEQDIAFASGRTPVFVVAAPTAIEKAIDAHYSPEDAVEGILKRVSVDLTSDVEIVEDSSASADTVEDAAAAPVVKLANVILRDGVKQRASDIHLEPSESGGAVRFRVDGIMRHYMHMPLTVLRRVISRIKVLGKMDIADRLRPQDGRTRIRIEGATYDLRMSTVPTRDAEKMVLRLLGTSQAVGLDSIGLPALELQGFRRLLSHRNGIVLVTGPTGSGKTTTLYAAIRDMATSEVNVVTVEDPVEYMLPGITQIQVEPDRDVTFASTLRAVLRQDPDVILVGEIRDLETAQTAVQASMTGHLVLATLHANDAVGVVSRLVDLGLDRPSIAATLRGSAAQRLVRRVCPACGGGARGTPDGATADQCERCAGSGYSGRMPVLELMRMTPEIEELIVKGAPATEIERAAHAAGMRPLRTVADELVVAGSTTAAEVDRVFGDLRHDVRAASGKPHVLVVDDDAVNRTLARALLEKQGMRVSEAENGIEAMACLTSPGNYSMIVLDLDMPEMGGREVMARVRGSVATAALPIVVLTGSNDPIDEPQVLEAGADDYIRKPIDSHTFVARIRATLRRAAM